MSETENVRTTDADFLRLIASWSAAALQALGKLVNPATGRTERDLESARRLIDLIEMMERKTRGNLSDEERRTLRETLTLLRLNYVETAAEAAKAPAQGGESKEEKPAADAAKPETPPASGEPPAPDAPPRFHKSYG